MRHSPIATLACLALCAPLALPEDPDEKKDDKPKWDVQAPYGPTREVAIDVDEGTWMSVDVSPDGRELVFDLLGDLYLLPIEGGEARAITSGVAWDMQPRFAPDGKSIAFTSDRVGGDNLWLVERDGSKPRQVSQEEFRLPTSPCWSPDGQFLAARKHFTSRRSLGAGEIWLYHVSGGEGLQMTVKPTEQKDVGEPAFSPDGRYLYYSLDVTPGPNFEYSKDSTGEIYAIHRLDRRNGEIFPVATGPGGACRPTPSPDGEKLAFVRRVRFQSTLFVMDLRTGEARPIWDGLERDMQETWAIHGVYPAFAWTGDSRDLVLWAKGKLWRVDAQNGAARAIPFHVKDSRTLAESLHGKFAAAPDHFHVKALRWVRVSPQGDLAAYQALGHIWVRPLPDGAPRRLTSADAHFELHPSFSRDGRWIVYTAWNDEELGSIRVAPASGGAARTVTRDPGHYVDPVFTPDGAHIVYARVEGGGIVSPAWGMETGIWSIPAEGGEPALVTRNGRQPQFGAENDRVYLLTVESQKDKDRRALVSIELDGSDLRTHLVSENASQFALSPDGKWVAFLDHFQAYVAPFAVTGREVEIGPKSKALPVVRVSRDAGENLQWSGDSTALHWSLGPELFTRELTDAFAFVAGAPEKLPEPPERGRDISFDADADVPAGSFAVVNARLITLRGDEVIERGAIVVEQNRIAAIGPVESVVLPIGARVVDAEGATLMPGIIDVHAHGPQAEDGRIPQRNWASYANLAFGVTTIHDPSHDTNSIFAASELARTGTILAPRTFSTGTILYGAKSPFTAQIDSLDDARSHLRRLQAVGAFSVKSYNQPRRDQRQEVVAAARELGMLVVPEGGSLFMHNLTQVVDGHTKLEHSLPVEKIYRDVVQLWGPSGVGYTPTLIVGYGGIWGEHYFYDKDDVWKDERLMHFVPRNVVDPRARRRTKSPDEDYNVLRSSGICKALADAGVSVELGAHGQLAGLGAHWELWLFGMGGMTPLQALRAATLAGAESIGMGADLGSLEVGKLADFLVLEANPLEDLRHSTAIRTTVLNGRMYDARTLRRLDDSGPGPEPKFFWQELQNALPERLTDSACAGCVRRQ